MNKTLYIEAKSGIAGNMFAGALLDLGVPEVHLRAELSKLPPDEYELVISKVNKRGITATYFDVVLPEKEVSPRHLPDILQILQQSTLAPEVKQKAASVFWQLAQAESQAHGIAPAEVHFHEVGAVDCIIDIVSVAVGLTYLEIDTVLCSAIATGSGIVTAAHGTMPIPAPATAALLTDIPLTVGTPEYELTTPTGAALVRTFATAYDVMPSGLVIDRVGYGAGTYDLPVSNTLGLYLGYLLPKTDWKLDAPYIFGQNP